MSDGPFKNLKLNKRWKRFAEAVQNSAFSSHVCCDMASDALMHEVLTEGVHSLLADLQSYTNQKQLELNPLLAVENIFNAHMKTPFTDILQKEITLCLSDQVALTDAIGKSMKVCVNEQINEIMNRIQEECIIARDCKEMSQVQFNHTLNQAGSILSSLSVDNICQALFSGNKNAFKKVVTKQERIEDGPPL